LPRRLTQGWQDHERHGKNEELNAHGVSFLFGCAGFPAGFEDPTLSDRRTVPPDAAGKEGQ